MGGENEITLLLFLGVIYACGRHWGNCAYKQMNKLRGQINATGHGNETPSFPMSNVL